MPIHEIHELYLKFLKDFWNHGGRKRAPMGLERFTSWWETLTNDQQQYYRDLYTSGYNSLDDDLSQVAAMLQKYCGKPFATASS